MQEGNAAVSDQQPSSSPPPSSSAPARRPLEPEQTAAQKRLTNLHITAYPGLLNTDRLPPATLQATDFSAIDPTIHRKNHAVRNNNVTTFTRLGNGKSDAAGSGAVTMMTEKQMAARLTSLGIQMHQARVQQQQQQHTGSDGSGTTTTTTAGGLGGKGYHTHLLAPPFDERSTYRSDYCQEGPSSFQDAGWRARLANYRDSWSAEEKRDVDVSMKQPFLTCPDSVCRGQPTEYRAGYMPEAAESDFRLLSHKANLQELGTTFAYSAYGVDDPRRTIGFDASVVQLKEPRDVLYSASRNGKGSAVNADGSVRHTRKEESELAKMRALRTDSLKRSCMLRESRRAAEAEENKNAAGGSGRARTQTHRADDYIYLPRSQFV